MYSVYRCSLGIVHMWNLISVEFCDSGWTKNQNAKTSLTETAEATNETTWYSVDTACHKDLLLTATWSTRISAKVSDWH